MDVRTREQKLNEKAWIRKARAGDAGAFRRLVEAHAPVIWTVINKMVSDRVLAQDCFQETVIKFWKGLPSFQGQSKLSTWLYRIAYHVCLDQLQANRRHTETDTLGDEEDAGEVSLPDPQHSGESLENELERRDAIARGLQTLPPEWRAMVILHYWKGRSIEEIAAITDRPANTVKVYLHRARKQLRAVLRSGGYPDGS